jgi:hypothetical protein
VKNVIRLERKAIGGAERLKKLKWGWEFLDGINMIKRIGEKQELGSSTELSLYG